MQEEVKTLPFGDIWAEYCARQGVAAAISVLMWIVPLIVFVSRQSKVVETMATSGIKE